jgi:hypothetical protein
MSKSKSAHMSEIRAREEAAQVLLGRVGMMDDSEAIKNTLRAAAGYALAQYPQYQGHWDNHQLCIVTKTIKTKMGVAFKKGDLALFAPVESESNGKEFADCDKVTVFSHRTGCDTIISRNSIKTV